MNAIENERLIAAELKSAAVHAGIVDLDALRMLDLSSVKMSASGAVEGAKELMDRAKAAKPHLFASAPAKHASQMTPAEYAAARSRIVRGAR